jgi:TetR/AcrR family transcriptional repressor of mexJK operon
MARTEKAPKRGRPTRAAEGSHRQKVLEAAENIFLAQGFGASSMDAVAKQAGVSKKTIYCLFETKEDLFEAIMRSHKEEEGGLQVHPAEVADLAAFEEALRDYLVRLGEMILMPLAVGLFRISISEAPRFPALAQAFYRQGIQRHLTQLTAWLSRQRAAGVVAFDDAEETAIMLTSYTILEPLRAAALGVRALPPAQQIEKRAHLAARMIARGAEVKRP